MSAKTVTISTPNYDIRVIERRDYDRNPAPRIYVADEVARTRSADFAEYERQEKALGEKRFAERGTDADVDALYDQLNAEIMRVKTEIAREVLVFLASDVTGGVDDAIERASFSRHAGCETCTCSPGVVAGAKLTWDDWGGAEFDVWVERP